MNNCQRTDIIVRHLLDSGKLYMRVRDTYLYLETHDLTYDTVRTAILTYPGDDSIPRTPTGVDQLVRHIRAEHHTLRMEKRLPKRILDHLTDV